MRSGFQGSKHDCSVTTTTPTCGGYGFANSSAELPFLVSAGVSDTPAPRFRHRAYLAALDAALYVGRYVLLAADNTSPRRVVTRAEALAALAAEECASVAGRLAEGLLGADIDVTDAVVGDACAEALVAWCVRHGLPYVVRESGRAGGRHVIAVVTDAKVPVRQWARLCRRLSRLYDTSVQDRTGQHLRLLSAPHRIGLPAPVIACTATPAAVLDAVAITSKARADRKIRGGRRRPLKLRTGVVDGSRSAREFGVSCALARADYSAAQAWTVVAGLGGKAAELGQRWWRRYMWLSAVTVVAAERGLSEPAAWDLARTACAAVCLARGRDWWRESKWEPALAEARTDRPRRHHIDDTATDSADLAPEIRAEIDALRAGFEAAVAARLGGLHPQRLRSARAVLAALARAVVTRSGSVSSRCLSLWSLLDRKTVGRALATVIEAGIVTTTHAYQGGAADCAAYGIGPAAIEYVAAAQDQVSPTRGTTPPPTGRARPSRLRTEYRRDRAAWSARCDVLASLAPGERLADSQHPMAKALRSLHHQRTWWRSLTEAEQAARQEQRRRQLRAMDSTERSDWFRWLARREHINNSADRILTWRAAADDPETVLSAPLTLHRGMRDPRWRTGGTPATAAA